MTGKLENGTTTNDCATINWWKLINIRKQKVHFFLHRISPLLILSIGNNFFFILNKNIYWLLIEVSYYQQFIYPRMKHEIRGTEMRGTRTHNGLKLKKKNYKNGKNCEVFRWNARDIFLLFCFVWFWFELTRAGSRDRVEYLCYANLLR